MKIIIAFTWLCTLCTMTLSDGLSEYGSLDNGRVFRPAIDLKMVESRPTKQKVGVVHNPRKQTPRPSPQVIYGKPEQTRPSITRTSHKKFRPSPEDPFFPSEVLNYAPSHKYLQKYANQLYTVQKNSGQLSEYQKFILNQDPAVKNFVFARAPKKISVEEPTEELPRVATRNPKIVTTTAKPFTTERVKTRREKKTKDVIEDSAAQSSGYKFIVKPEYIPVYTTQEDAFPIYDYAAPFTSHVSPSHPPPYKVPTTYGHGHKAVTEEHHDYPTKEPKYEFQYEVKDHEKNSNFGHVEARQGKTTWGKYYVQLSDGRFETVKYWADKTGYHAEVDYKGQAKHPHQKPKEVTVVRGYPADGLKLYGHESVTPHQLYSVSENPPIEYH